MNTQRLDIVAANLCGCVIEQIQQHEQRITVDLTDPRLGAMALTCEGATLLPPHVESSDGVECKQLKGIIDWVDVVHGNTLYIYLAQGKYLAIATRAAAIEQRT